MLFTSRRCGIDPLFGRQVYDMSANEVADATLKAVQSLRIVQRLETVRAVAEAMSECTKKNIKQSKRESMLQDTMHTLLKLDAAVLTHRLVPDVVHMIRTLSTIPSSRKDKSVAQWKEVVSEIQRYSR